MTEPRFSIPPASPLSPLEQERRREHLRAIATASPASATPEPIAVRLLGTGDEATLARLAARDSARAPQGDLLGAEISGRLVAALSLRDGAVIADPFRASAEAVELLRLRASQLGAGERRAWKRPKLRRRRRSRGALASSPPGGGGRLLQL